MKNSFFVGVFWFQLLASLISVSLQEAFSVTKQTVESIPEKLEKREG
jgi:hypothetical protein